MLRQRGWRNRTWAMLWAVLQFALPAAASSVDAHLERESRSQVTHVESSSTTSCRPVHAAECALCQLLSHDVAPVATSVLPLVATAMACPVPLDRLTPTTASIDRLPPARAPPIA